jgi:HTH-type transcriptional repressor of NAD biosynthesis genes
MTTTGLYLGKFAPLHKGHQYVIKTALDEVDELFLIIYDEPDVTDIPLSTRTKWIRDIYPSVNVIQAWGGPDEDGYTEELKNAHEKYVASLLPEDITIDRFYSSEPYGHHMSEFLDAIDRRVDEDRETVPISGTKIRNNSYENREYVSNRVYRDLITNVVFLGGPSTGKSTLAHQMADELNTNNMPEFGREYWEKNAVDRRLTKDQLVELAEEHLRREDNQLLESDTYLFTDTNALTTATFSQYYHNDIPRSLWNMAKNTRDRYDIHIVCGADIPYDDTEDRSGEANRQRLQNHTISLLEHFGIPYYTVTGNISERISKVKKILQNTSKWNTKI